MERRTTSRIALVILSALMIAAGIPPITSSARANAEFSLHDASSGLAAHAVVDAHSERVKELYGKPRSNRSHLALTQLPQRFEWRSLTVRVFAVDETQPFNHLAYSWPPAQGRAPPLSLQ